MKKLIFILIICVVCIGGVCGLAASQFIINASFELDADGIQGWQSEAAKGDKYIAGILDESYDAVGMCVSLKNTDDNHSRMYQRIDGVKRGEIYLITAFVKVPQEIFGGGAGITAQNINISKYGVNKISSERISKKCDWTELSLYVEIGQNADAFEIWLELGSLDSYAQGTAYFDNVNITKSETLPQGVEAALITGGRENTDIYIYVGVALCVALAGLTVFRIKSSGKNEDKEKTDTSDDSYVSNMSQKTAETYVTDEPDEI